MPRPANASDALKKRLGDALAVKKNTPNGASKTTVPAETCTTLAVAEKKPRRWRPGTVALRDMRKLQKSTDLQLKKTPFNRIVDNLLDMMGDENNTSYCMCADAREGLRAFTDGFMTDFLGEIGEFALHSKRVTIMKRDFDHAKRIFLDGNAMEKRPSNFGVSDALPISYDVTPAAPRLTANSGYTIDDSSDVSE